MLVSQSVISKRFRKKEVLREAVAIALHGTALGEGVGKIAPGAAYLRRSF
jgi:hypothetical protein